MMGIHSFYRKNRFFFVYIIDMIDNNTSVQKEEIVA